MWGSLFGRSAGSLKSDACGTEIFDGRIEYAEIGPLKLCKINSSPHRVTRTATAAQSDTRAYKVVTQFQGSSTFEQEGRRVLISPDEWTIYDSGKPYRVCSAVDVEQYVVTLPREAFAGPRFMMDGLVAQGFSARTGVGRLACSMVRAAFEEIYVSQLQSTEDLADTITKLFQQALYERLGPRTDISRSDILRDRMRTYICDNLRDPDLSISRLAQVMNQTKRNLHRVFSTEGQTISDFIWRMRLDWSSRALVNPTLEHRSITDIAFGCGFSSSAHFSRSFKEQFGMSPRDYRVSARNIAA